MHEYSRQNFALISFVLLITCPSFSRTLIVPSEYELIYEAVIAAESGDEIVIEKGVYSGFGNHDIEIRNMDLTIRSNGEPEECIIDMEFTGRAFRIVQCDDVLIKGISFQNGRTHDMSGGGAIFAEHSNIRIRHCSFLDNYLYNHSGGAMQCINGTLELSECLFERNRTDDISGGAISMNSTTASISFCGFNHNSVGLQYIGTGGAIAMSNSICTVQNSYFNDNTAQASGSSVQCDRSILNLFDSSIQDSIPWGYVTCDLNNASCLLMRNCELTSLHEPVIQAGDASSVAMMNCLFHHCGKLLECFSLSSATIDFCTFALCSATDGPLFSFTDSTARISSSILWNEGVQIQTDQSTCEVDHSAVRGGYPGPGNIEWPPEFTRGPRGYFYLAHKASGQAVTSPCVNRTKRNASDVYFRTAADLYEFHEMTTRSDNVTDSLLADMGYHYLRSDYCPPDHAAEPNIRLVQSNQSPLPGDSYTLRADVFMVGFPVESPNRCFVLCFETGGAFFWYPGFGTEFTYQNLDIGPDDFSIPIMQFTWPETTGNIPPITFYSAFLTTDLSQIFGEWDLIRLIP